MLNGTIYDSRYRNMLGEWLNTKYNGSYASNGIFGKEFKVGTGKQHTISINSRYILAGGMRYLPIDEDASRENGYTVRIWDNGFEEKSADYFRVDLLFKFRRNQQKYTGEWSLDFLNILNRQNMLTEYWDAGINGFRKQYQNPFIFVLSYRIQF
jgi:hypothetical protein